MPLSAPTSDSLGDPFDVNSGDDRVPLGDFPPGPSFFSSSSYSLFLSTRSGWTPGPIYPLAVGRSLGRKSFLILGIDFPSRLKISGCFQNLLSVARRRRKGPRFFPLDSDQDSPVPFKSRISGPRLSLLNASSSLSRRSVRGSKDLGFFHFPRSPFPSIR